MRMWFFSERSLELANTLAKTVDVKRSLCGAIAAIGGHSLRGKKDTRGYHVDSGYSDIAHTWYSFRAFFLDFMWIWWSDWSDDASRLFFLLGIEFGTKIREGETKNIYLYYVTI